MIHLPAPCHENWDKMIPVEGGRHCSSCNKLIRDFTNHSQEEIVSLISSSATITCGRFRADQVTDGQTYGGWKYFFKWKSAVSVLLAGSMFLISCHKKSYKSGGSVWHLREHDHGDTVHVKWMLDQPHPAKPEKLK
jgi:hypothetical protein